MATSLIISPLRLRKIKIAMVATISSMLGMIFLTVYFNFNILLLDIELRNYETWAYLRQFPINFIGIGLSTAYDFLLSKWVINSIFWGMLLGSITSWLMIQKLVIGKDTTILRGNSIISASSLRELVKIENRNTIFDYFAKRFKRAPRIFLSKSKIPIPYHHENRSFLIVGQPGAGKSNTIMNMMTQITTFGETMIIYDRKPDFWQRFFRAEKDFLFYPSEARSIKWNFFLDIPEDEKKMLDEVDKIVKSFIPDNPNAKDKIWDNTARMVLKAIIIKVKVSLDPSPKKLIDLIKSVSTKDELYAKIKDVDTKYGLRVKTFLGDDAAATTGSIMINLEPYFAVIIRSEFYYDDGDFSIKKFINDTKDNNKDQRLFLVQTKEEEGNFSGYFRVMIDMMVRTILSFENKPDRAIWTFLDEFQTLGKLEEINDLVAEGRSKGSRVIISTQDMNRTEEAYGELRMRNLFQTLATKILMQYDDPNGQKFLIDFLGEQEVEEKNKNRMINRDASKDIEQISERNTTKKVLLAGELGMLKELHAYLKLPGFPLSKIGFKYFMPPELHIFQEAPSSNMFAKPIVITPTEVTSFETKDDEEILGKTKRKNAKKTKNYEYEEVDLNAELDDDDIEDKQKIQVSPQLLNSLS